MSDVADLFLTQATSEVLKYEYTPFTIAELGLKLRYVDLDDITNGRVDPTDSVL
jgi:hypothetical protein